MAMFGFSDVEVRSYLILSVCGGFQLLINQIEEPYARSLVVCDTPVNTTLGAEPSGSAHCGDRLHVIGEGALLCGNGQSLENIGRFLITLFVSGFADSHGRKAASLVGWSFIMASVICFLMASFVRPWARVLYIVGQGLQGMSGIGLMSEIVTTDIAQRSGDHVGVFARRDGVGMLLGIVFFAMVMLIQYVAITEFRFVWLAVCLVCFLILLALVYVFPETQAAEERQREHKGLGRIILGEVAEYKRIIEESEFMKYHFMMEIFSNLDKGVLAIMMPWMMAYQGYTQFDLMVRGIPLVFLGLPFMPLLRLICRKAGHRMAWNFAVAWDKGLNLLCLPFIRYDWGLPMLMTLPYLKLPISGFPSLNSSVISRIVPIKANAKFQAMNQLLGFFITSVSALLYSRVFVTDSQNYFVQLLPFINANIFAAFGFAIYWNGHREILLAECDNLTAEAREAEAKAEAEVGEAEAKEAEPQAAAEALEEPKPDGEKKTD